MKAIFPPDNAFFGSAQVLQSPFGVLKCRERAFFQALFPPGGLFFCSSLAQESPLFRRRGYGRSNRLLDALPYLVESTPSVSENLVGRTIASLEWGCVSDALMSWEGQ